MTTRLERASDALDVEDGVEANLKRVFHLVAQKTIEVVQQRHKEEAVELELDRLNDVCANTGEDLTNQHVNNIHRDRLHRSVPERVFNQIRELAVLQLLIRHHELATGAALFVFRVMFAFMRRQDVS